MKKPVFLVATTLFLLCITFTARAQQNVDLSQSQMPSVVTVPPEALPSNHFDPEAATNAYLAQIPTSARARSDAYFEGGYWLLMWDLLMDVAIYWVLLQFGWSARMRDLAERITRFKPLQTFLYWLQFSLVGFVLGAPLGIYEGYIRERKYGLATQTFGPWLGEQLKALLIAIVFGGIVALVLVGVVRRWPKSWHIRCAIVSMVFSILLIMIVPVVLVPMFNTPKRLEDPKVTAPILSLARANGIPAHDVYEIDASKQSTRMSANVSGFGKTMRITMNDNLLKRGSPEEIQEAMGHEMGHYVLNHISKDVLFFFVVITVFFALLRWTLDWSFVRCGEKWHLRGFEDVAAIPLVFLIGSVYFFLLTPILNTHTRTSELEADMYGLNASRQPDGAAQGAIHLGEYRKMSPGPIEEWIFYDHPSGRTRIYNAMRWKAENLQLFQNQSAK
jgi:STE24 endopeptidase